MLGTRLNQRKILVRKRFDNDSNIGGSLEVAVLQLAQIEIGSQLPAQIFGIKLDAASGEQQAIGK